MTTRPLWNRAWYKGLQALCRLTSVLTCGMRVYGRGNIPPAGGVLVLSNHQSHLDPVLVGLSCDRRLNYVARDTLFGFAPFRWLIQSLDAIPLDREGLGLSGIKETLRRLKRGEMVLLFPEGTRSPDGEVKHLKPGFCALARRAEVPLLPVALDGAFEAWPRKSMLPRPAPIGLCIGEPIWPHQAAALDDDQLLAEVERRIIAAHVAARRANDRRAR